MNSPREVIAAALHWVPAPENAADDVLQALANNHLVILKRPLKDRESAALYAYEGNHGYSRRERVRAALAAAEAADTRPRELHDELVKEAASDEREARAWEPDSLRVNEFTASARANRSAARLIGLKFNLPEVNGDG